MHTPGVGVVWDSGYEPRYLGSGFSYPLKTSLCCSQFWCGIPLDLSVFCHVVLTSLCVSYDSRSFVFLPSPPHVLAGQTGVFPYGGWGELARMARGHRCHRCCGWLGAMCDGFIN